MDPPRGKTLNLNPPRARGVERVERSPNSAFMIKKIFGRAADGKYRALRKRALQNVPEWACELR